ncbi:hypothetical protein E2C01_101692 [Portunus trituberculatus]|uniref:Uncharacterized protein n=1 Tax=Portunus trituberculatus TaxID=210409 RepID=A0A5B7KFJ1_PORTR|nr:hypothetical protein [Portunus trituberculatus]
MMVHPKARLDGLRLARHGCQETGSGPQSERAQENLPSLGLVAQTSGREPEFSAGDGTSKIRNVKQIDSITK